MLARSNATGDLEQNGTWELVALLKGKNDIGCQDQNEARWQNGTLRG